MAETLGSTERQEAAATRRGPGRPRGFDRDTALQAAMLVFWRNGFDGTSYSDLTAATGMSKPTLYATFGDKVNLFRESVVAYSEWSAKLYLDALARPTSREVVETCLRLARGLDPRPGEPVVCFLVQGALTGSADTQALRDELAVLRQDATRMLADRLRRARDEGDLPPSADPEALAEYISALATGLSVQATGGASPELLRRVVDLTMAQWPGR